ncbi:fructose 2,6-bisphosphatase [Levilactobacillus zymae]|uniref:Fructose 2,6-bisphosphatase n=1 Tax=Levilactobacillus zymae TaxID=267363 RepID=A0ABQ0WYZ4_9LACO|nr:histidine phosphatase family protein [Levilactobacillus zymae]KRL11740.1 phosphoglycerate mutase [Levilactobacillus zymae DSM 19395]QFR62369.1 histidine phosphatase family protein [Levilactobacillus zymae]GEO73149.1 fructose 2,6-bisphosphatase [Levilactobacillus zymae]
MTTIDWVRHGQTHANVSHMIQGQLDTAVTLMTSTGERQVQDLLAHLEMTDYNRIVVSPLQRTRQTAAILTTGSADTLPLTLDQRLVEGDYGDWTGQSTAELQKRYPDAFDPLTHEVLPDWLPRTGGESYRQIQARVGQLVAELVVDHPYEHILVVSHGLTIKLAALLMLGLGTSQALPEPRNASLTRMTVDPATGHRYLRGYSLTRLGL